MQGNLIYYEGISTLNHFCDTFLALNKPNFFMIMLQLKCIYRFLTMINLS